MTVEQYESMLRQAHNKLPKAEGKIVHLTVSMEGLHSLCQTYAGRLHLWKQAFKDLNKAYNLPQETLTFATQSSTVAKLITTAMNTMAKELWQRVPRLGE